MNRRVMFIAPVAYSGLRQRHQGLAAELVQAGYRVEYIDPLAGGGFSARSRVISDHENPTAQTRLRVWSIAVPFRAARWPALQKHVIALAWRLLRRAGLPFESHDLLWIADPSWSSLVGRFAGFRLYDRCDRHGVFPGQNPAPWRQHEQVLYAASDLVLATTGVLADEARQGGARAVQVVPNAVDASWLAGGIPQDPIARETAFPKAGEPLKLLSAGAHYEWIDCDWLLGLADHADFELHIAGPGRGTGWEKLCRHPRLRNHGRLEHDALRRLMSTMHVGLIPFLPSPLTETVDPVKVYEYAATGLQVWGTPVEALRSHPLVDRIVADPRRLERSSIVSVDAQTRSSRRIPTWRDRLSSILDRLPSPEA